MKKKEKGVLSMECLACDNGDEWALIYHGGGDWRCSQCGRLVSVMERVRTMADLASRSVSPHVAEHTVAVQLHGRQGVIIGVASAWDALGLMLHDPSSEPPEDQHDEDVGMFIPWSNIDFVRSLHRSEVLRMQQLRAARRAVVYANTRFRSDVDAMWAVFFDTQQITWEYQQEQQDLGDLGGGLIPFLPTFWLPQVNMFAVVQPGPFGGVDRRTSMILAIRTGHGYLLLDGPPQHQTYFGAEPVDAGVSGGGAPSASETDFDLEEGHHYWLYEHRFYSWSGNEPGDRSSSSGHDPTDPAVCPAAAARHTHFTPAVCPM